METQNRKRTRADEETEPDDHDKGKRSSSESVHDSHENYDRAQYEFCDGFGVFDFPWLKEGVIFIADESLGHDEKFVPYDEAFAANFDQSCVQNLFAYSPADMSEYNIHDKKLDDEDGFWSSGIDDFERLDCIWSCPCDDQPLDIGLNKGVDCNS